MLKTLFPTLQEIPAEHDCLTENQPYEKGLDYLIKGEVRRWKGESAPVFSPVLIRNGDQLEPRLLGHTAQLTTEAALECLEAAVQAYDRGTGAWPTMRVSSRIECLQVFVAKMRAVREESVRLLMWEIGKTRADSEKEFDRTVQYILDTIEALKEMDRTAGRFTVHSGILAQVRRSPLGVVLCMGPFNYPLNETFTTLIPALIMGNTAVVKLPRFGVLCQAPLLRCFAESFPPGVVNIFNGDGKLTVGPIMQSGKVASLAFIGSSAVSDVLKKQHPHLHRCRCVLGLDAKNPAVLLDDADLDLAVNECINGAVSFNGQRCTAIKIIYVQRKLADRFVEKMALAMDQLKLGMPWEKGVKITPLPEPGKAEKMKSLVEDAVQKGARIVNQKGGESSGSLYHPALVYPVRPEMQLYHVEQFGPVVPVAVFDDIEEVFEAMANSNFGQQASLFGYHPKTMGQLADVLSNQVCRININAQCQRGPDVFPFTGRKDSAEGTLSVSDALRCFSIRSMVATQDNEEGRDVMKNILSGRTSNFINTDYIF